MVQLICKELSLGYDGKSVVNGLSFEVNKGDYICIAGENGSGKTTLMKTLLHLMPPLGGSIITGEAFSLDDIGYLPQQRQVQWDFPASVYEIVLSGTISRLKKRAFYGKEEKKAACDSMDRLGISFLKKKRFSELSGGQQQRVLLARAFCATRKMLLLDEPVSGLDPRFSSEMYDMIKELNDEGITILMISHDRRALDYADHVLHIGDSLFFGTTGAYLSSPLGKTFYEYEGRRS